MKRNLKKAFCNCPVRFAHLLRKARPYSSKAKAGRTLNVGAGACALPCTWKGACDWTAAVSFLGAVFVLTLSLTASGGEGEGAITVTDMTGRNLTLDHPAEKVVALQPSDCEILYALGAGDRLVGRGAYCDYPAEVSNVPQVQSGADTNVEEIISLNPDLVLMNTMSQSEDQLKMLERAGIPVAESVASDIDGVYDGITMIGELTGLRDEAEALISSMKETFEEVSRNAGDFSRSIYFEVSPLEYGLWTAGKNTFMDEVATMLGLRNCFADVDGWGEISEEEVLERDPDYIVTISMYFGEGPTPEEEIASRTGWGSISAVKSGRILNLRGDELSRPGPRLAAGARLVYDFVHETDTESGVETESEAGTARGMNEDAA